MEFFYVVAGKMAKHIISEKLYSYITEKLTGKYGHDVDPLITKRLEEEWDAICTKELVVLLAVSCLLYTSPSPRD